MPEMSIKLGVVESTLIDKQCTKYARTRDFFDTYFPV